MLASDKVPRLHYAQECSKARGQSRHAEGYSCAGILAIVEASQVRSLTHGIREYEFW